MVFHQPQLRLNGDHRGGLKINVQQIEMSSICLYLGHFGTFWDMIQLRG